MIERYDAALVADMLAGKLEAAVHARGVAGLAIPGGRSPGPVLTALAGLLQPATTERLHLFWLDERAVPVGHADRNDAATLAAWEQGGPLPAFVHPMPAESPDLDAAARQYAQILRDALAGRPLDACLIGIGEDGHFASLFPNHAALQANEPVLAISDSPKPPPRRLTLSLPEIARAGWHAVLVLGASKGALIPAATSPTPALPFSLLPADRTVLFLDAAALDAAG